MKFKLKQPNLKFIMTEQFVAKKYRLDWNAGMSWSGKRNFRIKVTGDEQLAPNQGHVA